MAKDDGQTVRQFGSQWVRFPDPSDRHHSSDLLFRDTLNGLINPLSISGKRVLEIGSGSGRLLQMIDRYKPIELVGLEPSSQFESLVEQFEKSPHIKIVRGSGETLLDGNFHFVFIVGVLHHIPEPLPVLRNARAMLAKDGVMFLWVYGSENEMKRWLPLIKAFRKITTRIPDGFLEPLSRVIALLIGIYARLANRSLKFKWPLRDYLNNVFIPCSFDKRVEIVFDQLNPKCSHYYSESELRHLLHLSGFSNITVTNRHEYSISAIASA